MRSRAKLYAATEKRVEASKYFVFEGVERFSADRIETL